MKLTFALLSLLICVASSKPAIASGPPAFDGNVSNGASGWEAMGGGMNGSVNSLAVYHGELIAVGGFTTASGNTVDRVARWTGSSWVALPGGGADGGLWRAVVYRDWLIVGGSFETIGGVAADGLARWDGNHWSAMSGNLFLSVDELAVFADKLVVAGDSLASGAMEYIAAWNGDSWSALGDGLEGSVDALGVHAGNLYASSSLPFPEFGDAIWRWNGTTWSIFEDQIDDTVYAYGDDGGRLVAAGWFQSIGGASENRIAAWNGTAWEPLGAGIGSGLPNQRVVTLASYGGELWAGGYFERAGGEPASHIARWDGTAWSSPGSGADGEIEVFATYNGSLIAAGAFAEIDGQTVNYIARWTSDPVFGNGFD